MNIESLKKMAQDAIGTAKDRVEKAISLPGHVTTGMDGSVRSGAPLSFDGIVKVLTRTATDAIEALGETKQGRKVVEGGKAIKAGYTTTIETANRIARAAQAAKEAFAADPPGEAAAKANGVQRSSSRKR